MREKEKLIKLFSLRKTNFCEVWAQDANNLDLIIETFQSMQKAAEYFNVDY